MDVAPLLIAKEWLETALLLLFLLPAILAGYAFLTLFNWRR